MEWRAVKHDVTNAEGGENLFYYLGICEDRFRFSHSLIFSKKKKINKLEKQLHFPPEIDYICNFSVGRNPSLKRL